MFKPTSSLSLLRTGLLIALLSLSACTSMTNLKSDISENIFGREPVNPPTPLEDIKAAYTGHIDWSINTGKTGRFSFTPAVDAGYAYASDSEGEVYKVDISSGKLAWRQQLNETISGGVGLGGGLVLVGTKTGRLVALDTSGKALWKSNLSSEILSVPRYSDGIVIVRTGDQHIYGIDAADGSRKWVYERATPSLALSSNSGVTVDSGAVYAGFPGGKLIALRADNGKMLWEVTVAQPKGVTEIERIADITSLPIVDGPILFVVAYQGKVAAIDRRNGQNIWNRDISSYSGLAYKEHKLYVSHTLGSVYSLNDDTGKTFWRQGNLAYRNLTQPLPLESVVALGDVEGYVHLLANDEGKFVGRVRLDSKPVMAVVEGNNASQFVAQTRDGSLYAVTVK